VTPPNGSVPASVASFVQIARFKRDNRHQFPNDFGYKIRAWEQVRTMGGLGSGRFGRRAIKQKIEHCWRQDVDVREIRRALLQADPSVLFHRPALSGRGADYAFTVEVGNIRISSKTRTDHGEWKLTSETVAFETTPCRYGGARYWLRCPACIAEQWSSI
jgi:hypothetical protein